MRALNLLLKAAAVSASAMYMTAMPQMTTPPIITETETISTDPWQCATKNLPQYFDPPKPTGALLSAIQSYGGEVVKKTCTFTGTSRLDCPFPKKSDWCKFSTIAPSTLVPEYSSYGSVVNSWWEAHSSAAASLAYECPMGWHKAMVETPNGEGWFNNTVAHAECYADAHLTSSTEPTSTAPLA